jgi:hypothetical protein
VTDDRHGPRPLLVGAGSLLLIATGLAQLALATIVLAAFGVPALVFSVLVGALGVCGLLFGGRIRGGRDRRPALITAFVMFVSAPLLWGTGVLALATVVGSVVPLLALVRERAWFEPPSSEPLAQDEPPA